MSNQSILSEQEKRNLRGFIDRWRASPHQVFSDAAIGHIEDMFRPYLRGKFPREALESVLRMVSRGCAVGRGEEAIQTALVHAERLLNDGPTGLSRREPADDTLPSGGLCEHGQVSGECPKCCPTCGGSEKVPHRPELKCNDKCKIPEHWISCPACTEKPKCLRCGRIRGHTFMCAENINSCQFVDQRKGQQRVRRISAGMYHHEDGTPFYYYGPLSRPLPDRREEDRRSKILTGSLKAMRPQE